MKTNSYIKAPSSYKASSASTAVETHVRENVNPITGGWGGGGNRNLNNLIGRKGRHQERGQLRVHWSRSVPAARRGACCFLRGMSAPWEPGRLIDGGPADPGRARGNPRSFDTVSHTPPHPPPGAFSELPHGSGCKCGD